MRVAERVAQSARAVSSCSPGAVEDPVVRDEWYSEADRCCSDPAVGSVLFLSEGVARGFAVGLELCIDRYELRPGVKNLHPLDLRLQRQHPCPAPAAPDCAVTQLRDRLEGDNGWPTRDERRVALGQSRAQEKICAEDVGIDHDRPA